MWHSSRPSLLLELDVCSLDELGELGRLRLEHRRELFRRRNERLESLLLESVLQVGRSQDSVMSAESLSTTGPGVAAGACIPCQPISL